MPVVLFWNVARKDIADVISDACEENNVRILLLAECEMKSTEILLSLNRNIATGVFTEYRVTGGYVRIFVRYDQAMIRPLFDDSRSSIRVFDMPVGPPLILVGCHLPSKLHKIEEDQYYYVRQLVQEIYRCEELEGHDNTIVIGDMNINPYEIAMVAADGFHATMDKRIAIRGGRFAAGKRWKFFFNPIWSTLGDETVGPPGTYYYSNGGGLVNMYWNSFDQCLIRPSLLKYYKSGNFKVITTVMGKSLLIRTSIDKSYSDHLPILLSLNTEL